MTSLNGVIIFSRTGIPLDVAAARRTLAHVRRRGYKIVAVVREWGLVDQALASKTAHVVVFARGERGVEMSNETTRRLPSAADLTRERVRQIVDCDATVPIGLDPEMVAAARQIASRLAQADAGGPSPSVQDQGCI